MIPFLQSRAHSFHNAFSGLWYVIRTQKNAWIHLLATFLTILFAFWLQISRIEWTVMIITIGTVWTAEFINTALEAVVDLASPFNHPLAKVGKDVGAAAVLIAAISSVAIGILILGPPLLIKLRPLFQN